jgi:hypothetical protein
MEWEGLAVSRGGGDILIGIEMEVRNAAAAVHPQNDILPRVVHLRAADHLPTLQRRAARVTLQHRAPPGGESPVDDRLRSRYSARGAQRVLRGD